MFNDFEIKFSKDDGWKLRYLHVYHGIYIANSENEYKKGNKIQVPTDCSFEINKEESDSLGEYFVLSIISKGLIVYVRADQKIALEYIIYNSQQKNERDMGRPMTFVPHVVNVDSVLYHTRINQFQFQGIINLVVTALIVSHLRLMYDNFKEAGIILFKRSVFDLLGKDSGEFIFLYGVFIIFAIFTCFMIERLAARIKNEAITNLLNFGNFSILLSSPFILHYFGYYNPIIGQFALILITIIFLKLYSFSHFWNDVRKFIYKKKKLKEEAKEKRITEQKKRHSNAELKKILSDKKMLKEFEKQDEQAVEKNEFVIDKTDKLKSSLYEEIESIISDYPNNVSFYNLMEFLFMPILCFQYKFPRTSKIRITYLLEYGIKVIICSFFQYFILIQWIVPLAKKACQYAVEEQYGLAFEKLLKLAIPNVYLWLLMFYSLFHCMLNFCAEITRFGDRQFYKDWWNSTFIDEYWRTWNLPTHYWLMRHIYNPLRRRRVSKLLSGAFVYFISAVFHEYIISGGLGKLHFSAFLAMFGNFPTVLVQEYLKKLKVISNSSHTLNVLFWISFCFLGQPLCFVLYFYSYYKDHPEYLYAGDIKA